MLELVKTLCALPGVSGCESAVAKFIYNEARPYADEIYQDAMGSLIVFKKGSRAPEKKLMLAAHMDEVGIIVKSVTDDGFLRFAFVGGVDRRVTIGQRVYIGENAIPGVIGIKAIHLVKKSEEKKIPKIEDMYIDIGADDKAAAEGLVSPGDFGSFDPECVEFGHGLLKAKAIDDRCGCAVLLSLIKEPLPVDAWFCFTVQEELGTRGAFGAAFSVTPDIALVVEGTTAADIPSVDKHKRICSPGRGVVIPFMDGGTIYDRELFTLLRDLADKNGIPWQTKEFISGGTDASAIQKSKEGVRVAGIAAAVRYIHSPSSVASSVDICGLLRLARAFLESFSH